MPHFLVCIHDATPAYARETRDMIRDLAPLVGRRFSCGVVPDWHGEWPLAAHSDFCELVREASDELLLHGYFHRRQRGWGPIALIAEHSDEMNGLDRKGTRRAIERGQRTFLAAFGEPARGFIAPAWQTGYVRPGTGNTSGLEHLLGFFSLESSDGRSVPLATWTWDCGRWSPLGHVGHAIGSLLQSSVRRVPSLAIHPRDMERGFWPKILRLIRDLIDMKYEPSTPGRLLETRRC